MTSRIGAVVLTVVLGLAAAATPTLGYEPAAKHYRNCTALNKVYKHGVGRPNAVDHTSGSPKVTNFYRSRPLYRANKDKDRDGDGIACEKR
jgi:hypothetical protein